MEIWEENFRGFIESLLFSLNLISMEAKKRREETFFFLKNRFPERRFIAKGIECWLLRNLALVCFGRRRLSDFGPRWLGCRRGFCFCCYFFSVLFWESKVRWIEIEKKGYKIYKLIFRDEIEWETEKKRMIKRERKWSRTYKTTMKTFHLSVLMSFLSQPKKQRGRIEWNLF